jgi:hypothetical protein|tara:strand:- start:164 stop:451 length:288 start_codon:yes stop_codon:yes gene_type:complete
MATPVDEMEEESLIRLTEMLGSREEAIAKYDEWVDWQIAEDAKFEATQYQIDRRNNYPSIEEVTVALAEKADGDSTMWDEVQAKREAIKIEYPKP